MDSAVLNWLDSASILILRLALGGLLLVNLTAAVGYLKAPGHRFVDRWASSWLAANLILLGAGAGAPLVAGVAKLVVAGMSGMLGSATPTVVP